MQKSWWSMMVKFHWEVAKFAASEVRITRCSCFDNITANESKQSVECKTVVFGRCKAPKAWSSSVKRMSLTCPQGVWGKKTTVCFSYNEFVLSGGHNVTEVTEIAWQLHPHLKFDTLDALISCEICCVVVMKFLSFGSVVIWKGWALLFFCKM